MTPEAVRLGPSPPDWSGRSGHGLGDAEVHHLDVTIGGQHHVRRLEIAVHDAPLAGKFEGFGDLRSDLERFGQRHRAARESILQRLALDQLHRNERMLVGRTGVVHLRDEGVIEARGGVGFPNQALARDRIGRLTLGQKLERRLAIECEVLREVDLAHAPFTNL